MQHPCMHRIIIMSDKNSSIYISIRSTQQDETQSYSMERLTSEAPPLYSEVLGHSWTVNDSASGRNGPAPPYQLAVVQQETSSPPVRLVSNDPMPPARVVVVTPPIPRTVPGRRPELCTGACYTIFSTRSSGKQTALHSIMVNYTLFFGHTALTVTHPASPSSTVFVRYMYKKLLYISL